MLTDLAWVLTGVLLLVELAVVLRAMLRPLREPASRIAWVIAILVVPVVGVVAYLLLGEARISARRRARYAAIEARMPRPDGDPEAAQLLGGSAYAAPFALGRSVNGLPPTLYNRAALASGSDAAIAAMIANIDAATFMGLLARAA